VTAGGAEWLDPTMTSAQNDEPHSWLYVRNNESVRVFQFSPVELAICGPGYRRSSVRFNTHAELFAYRQQNADALLGAGYRFEGFCVERRLGVDRRRGPRLSDERRGA
jgi:hypothetical protein